jgi:aminopeptidase N
MTGNGEDWMEKASLPHLTDSPYTPGRQRLYIVLAVCLLLSLSVQVTATRRERVVDTWRPIHYAINIKFNDTLSTIAEARTEIKARALKNISQIDLDFGAMRLESILVNYQVAKFEHKAGIVRIKLPEIQPKESHFTILAVYNGKPGDGLILAADKDGKPTAIGDNWPDRLHHWVPCLDHPSAKATVSFTVTAPEQNLVVANGSLDRVETRHGTRTWSFSEEAPIPPYCMIIAVGQFAKLDAGKPFAVPLGFYVPHSDKKYATKGFSSAGAALRLLTQNVAPYPYEKLALIVGNTRFGGMENAGAIVFSSSLFDPYPNPRISRAFGIRMGIVDLVAHEIAHQWFGDSVTASTWADLWLSEGFATYFSAVFIQRYEGEQAFQDYMKRGAESYFRYEQRTRTPIHDRETEDLVKLLNPNNYQKGGWILHMLRSILGDDAFFRGIRDYYNTHKHSTASTEDLRAALEKSSGKNLKDFFARWIYGTGHPHYEVTWKWRKGELLVTVRQIQPEPAFTNPLPIDIVSEAGKDSVTINPKGKETVETFRVSGQPVSIEVDPNNTILKEISLKPK